MHQLVSPPLITHGSRLHVSSFLVDIHQLLQMYYMYCTVNVLYCMYALPNTVIMKVIHLMKCNGTGFSRSGLSCQGGVVGI